ncbi:DUF2909 domain-containing protein [Sinimarinibacterium thermocellulolyticum]|uniref:DUF2909 domain-containing protein n=1 Tax=Sinimarinibacterium thermocellulolyticum TaxID=3170016 RepID=A0ABV2ADJ2_9GAMM
MIVKLIIIGLLLAILASLFTSMSFLLRDESRRRRTLTALKIRVALSITLVLFVLLSWYMGWIEPHALMRTPMPNP